MHKPHQDPKSQVQDHPGSGQEFDQDVHVPVTLGFGIGIVVTSVLTFIGMWFLLNQFLGMDEGRQVAAAPRVEQAPPPEPRLQIHPEEELQSMLQEQNDHLHSYGWVDQAEDRGYIAIEDAMQLIADQRLPVRSHPRSWENPLIWRDQSLMHANPEEGH